MFARKVEQNRRQMHFYHLIRDSIDFNDFDFLKVISSFAFFMRDYRVKTVAIFLLLLLNWLDWRLIKLCYWKKGRSVSREYILYPRLAIIFYLFYSCICKIDKYLHVILIFYVKKIIYLIFIIYFIHYIDT